MSQEVTILAGSPPGASDIKTALLQKARQALALIPPDFFKRHNRAELTIVMLSYGRLDRTLQAIRALQEYVSIPFELIANHTGYYVYYGNQPLRILEWPAWWGPVNFAVPIVAAIMIDRFRKHLPGPRMLALAFLLPMADGGVNGATAWPVWSALNSPGLPTAIVQAAGLLTVSLAVLVDRLG